MNLQKRTCVIRVVGCFPDGESALMLVCARLRYVASKDWGTKRYLNMRHLYDMENQREVEKEMERNKESA